MTVRPALLAALLLAARAEAAQVLIAPETIGPMPLETGAPLALPEGSPLARHPSFERIALAGLGAPMSAGWTPRIFWGDGMATPASSPFLIAIGRPAWGRSVPPVLEDARALEAGRALFDRAAARARPSAVAVDTNLLSYKLLRGKDDFPHAGLFADTTVRLQLSRQVMNEAIASPDLSVDSRLRFREGIERLAVAGKLYVSGSSQMTAGMLADFRDIVRLVANNLSHADARVLADAIVKGTPLATADDRMANGLRSALNSPALRRFLARRGYPTRAEDILYHGL